MKTFHYLATTLVIAGSALAPLVRADNDVLYVPARSIKDQKITVKPWGSGTIAESDETAPPGAGTTSIRISTRNLFQGGIITLGNPVDLSGDYSDKGNCLKIVYRLADQSVVQSGRGGRGKGIGAGDEGKGGKGGFGPGGVGPGGIGGARGGKGALPPGGFSGGAGAPGQGSGGPGGFGGPGGPGGFGPGGKGGTQSNANKTLKNLRFVITTTDGLKSEAYVPAAPTPRGDAWPQVAVPLQAISGFGRTNKIIQSVALAGDATTTFFVGGIQVVNDPTPISGSILVFGSQAGALNLALGDEVDFSAIGFAGSSSLRYAWSFDSANNAEPDAMGQTVKRKFRKPGDFTITLTISDVFGLKKPYTTTITAKVNP